MPNYFHFLRIVVIAASSCPVPSHSSSFVMPSLWRSLLFKNVCTLESRALVRRQVSESYIEVLIFEYPQLCLEGDGSCFPDSCETHVNPWCVFLICCHTHYAAKGKLIVCFLDVFIPSAEDAISTRILISWVFPELILVLLLHMHSGVAPFSHGCIEAYDFGNTSRSSAKPRSSNLLLESTV